MRKFATSQLARTLATLLGGGIPLVNALEIAARVDVATASGRASSSGRAAACRKARASPRRCASAASFPDVAVKMVEVGESTGALQEMLNSLADFYDEEIETEVERFITLIEPVLLVVMGVVIAAVVLALYMPLFELSSVVRRLGTMATNRPDQAWSRRPEDASDEVARARKLAERYRLEFVDMDEFRIDQELFRSIPADLMLRYGFVPYRRDGNALVIVVSDPTDLPMIDELSVVLRHADQGDGRRALGDPVDPEEERELAARARGAPPRASSCRCSRRTRAATRASPSSG